MGLLFVVLSGFFIKTDTRIVVFFIYNNFVQAGML